MYYPMYLNKIPKNYLILPSIFCMMTTSQYYFRSKIRNYDTLKYENSNQ